MYINLQHLMPVDVINALNTNDIEITNHDFTDLQNSMVLVTRGKTQRAKDILKSLGITVIGDNWDAKLGKISKELTDLRNRQEKAGTKVVHTLSTLLGLPTKSV